MNMELDLKEYLDKEFGIIKTELKEHRETEHEIKLEIAGLKTNFKWLLAILSPIATALLVGITKIIFFS